MIDDRDSCNSRQDIIVCPAAAAATAAATVVKILPKKWEVEKIVIGVSLIFFAYDRQTLERHKPCAIHLFDSSFFFFFVQCGCFSFKWINYWRTKRHKVVRCYIVYNIGRIHFDFAACLSFIDCSKWEFCQISCKHGPHRVVANVGEWWWGRWWHVKLAEYYRYYTQSGNHFYNWILDPVGEHQHWQQLIRITVTS